MCDAVVELDQNLHIRHPCPKLARLLFKDTGAAALKGEQFASLVFGEEDRNRFTDFVAQRAAPVDNQDHNNNQRAQSVYLTLRDAGGIPVSVQVFHSCIQDPLEEVCHIVGVHEIERNPSDGVTDMLGRHQRDRDAPEGERGDTIGDGERVGEGVDSGENRQHAGEGDDADLVGHSTASATLGSALSARRCSRVPLIPQDRGEGHTTVIFNPLTDEIIASTIDFQSITRPLLRNASMKDILVNCEKFLVWVHWEVSESFNGAQPTKFRLEIGPSTDRQLAGFEFHADAMISEVREGVRISRWGIGQTRDSNDEVFDILCVDAQRT